MPCLKCCYILEEVHIRLRAEASALEKAMQTHSVGCGCGLIDASKKTLPYLLTKVNIHMQCKQAYFLYLGFVFVGRKFYYPYVFLFVLCKKKPVVMTLKLCAAVDDSWFI